MKKIIDLVRKIVIAFALSAITASFAVLAPAQNILPAPREEKLLNGLKVLLWNDARSANVTVNIRIHAGAAFDPQGKEGLMKILAENIFPNDATRDFFREDLGGSLEIVSNYDYIQINAASKPDGLLQMLETLSNAVSNPLIDKETTTKLRNALLTQLKTLESDPAYIVDRAVEKRLFGTFPYGRPMIGTSETVQKLDFADLIEAKQRFLSADNATIAITGNYDKQNAFRAIRRYFGGWLKSDKRVPSTFRQPDPPLTAILMVSSPTSEANAFRFSLRGVSRNDKNLASAYIFSIILEDRLKGKIGAARDGDIFVRNEAHVLPGMIVIGLANYRSGVSDGNMSTADIVSRLIALTVTEAEFSSAKSRFAQMWNGRDPVSFWLDADTFKTGNPSADMKIADSATISDVRAFAESIQKAPVAAVLLGKN